MVSGFSLHAEQAVVAEDCVGLESLCRYGLRAPFSQRRMQRHTDGRVPYHLRRPWSHEAPPVPPARSSVEERLDISACDSWDPEEAWTDVEFVHHGEPIGRAPACVCEERIAAGGLRWRGGTGTGTERENAYGLSPARGG
jgi:hypothetical protein